MAKETKVVKYADGTATVYTKNTQDGQACYYAQEIADGWQGDIYDVTQSEFELAAALETAMGTLSAAWARYQKGDDPRRELWPLVCSAARFYKPDCLTKIFKDRTDWSHAYSRERAIDNSRKRVMSIIGIPQRFFG